jgi:16S rRNA (guanine966-N2)-methyltransferase
MRIVAGKYGSRILKAPSSDAVRPTSDKLRGAIFNILRSRGVLDGAWAMDCFCGTGALGIEALSQGAEHCVFVDNARASFDLAKENAAALKIGDEAEFIFRDATKMGPRPPTIAARKFGFSRSAIPEKSGAPGAGIIATGRLAGGERDVCH